MDIQSSTASVEQERERKQNLLVIPLSNGGHILGHHMEPFFTPAPSRAMACSHLAHRPPSPALIRLLSFHLTPMRACLCENSLGMALSSVLKTNLSVAVSGCAHVLCRNPFSSG